MFDNIIIFIAAACGAASILKILIRFYIDHIYTPSPSEVLEQELTIDNDDVNLIIKTEGNINPSEVLDMIKGVDKGIMTVNDARTNAGLKPVEYEPFINFQKAAHDFGDTTKAVNVGGSTIRRASNCPNCGANLTQNGVCAYCGTTYN